MAAGRGGHAELNGDGDGDGRRGGHANRRDGGGPVAPPGGPTVVTVAAMTTAMSSTVTAKCGDERRGHGGCDDGWMALREAHDAAVMAVTAAAKEIRQPGMTVAAMTATVATALTAIVAFTVNGWW